MTETRNCLNCARYNGECSSWDCDFIDRFDAIRAYKLKRTRGEWKAYYHGSDSNYDMITYQCNICGYSQNYRSFFCPHCGTQMKEELE